MATVAEALSIALQHHQAGRLAEAEQFYRQILAADPQCADALHLLGVVAHQAGQNAAAVECISRAIAVRPADAAYHNSLGEALRGLGQIPRAADCYRRALELDPRFVEAHNNLGHTFRQQDDLPAAIACYRRAVELEPRFAMALNNLGNALAELGRLDEAAAALQQAVTLLPGYPPAHNNLGNVLKEQGQNDAALAAYDRAIQLNPAYAGAWYNRGAILGRLGQLDEAARHYRRALELKPDFAEAHGNLGLTLHQQGKFAEALACYRQALTLKPDDAGTCNNLGNAYKDLGQLSAALDWYRRAIELQPGHPTAYNNIANVLKSQGRIEEALSYYRRALECNPHDRGAHDNLLLALQYRSGVTAAELAAAHAEFGRRHDEPLPDGRQPHAADRDPGHRLRVGFVSADFAGHPVAYFLVRTLENLDPGAVEVFCYNDRILGDDFTRRLRAAAATWRDTIGWSDQRVAEQICEDRVDVLFDLAGHTAGNRLAVFARKPASIQITWIGYAGTTGLAAMDYILADRHEIPPDAEGNYRERVLRLPDGYVCYDPPADAPPIAPLPAAARGFVTFGSFNNPAKIGPQVAGVWARILRRLPTARLRLKSRGLEQAETAQHFAAAFAAHGIDPARVELTGWSAHAELLAAYGEIDVALDPFPYNGGLTTCEALWMGVPVITCPGETFAGRHSLSHLSSVGLAETIAHDLDEYVEIAVSLAKDLPRLSALRARLRPQMAASPLCDGPRFAANLTAVLRDVWRTWCEHHG